jgi:hypothetical protein
VKWQRGGRIGEVGTKGGADFLFKVSEVLQLLSASSSVCFLLEAGTQLATFA